jgi:hypothetical protein
MLAVFYVRSREASKAASREGTLPREVPRVLPYQGAMTFRPHGDVVGRYECNQRRCCREFPAGLRLGPRQKRRFGRAERFIPGDRAR